VGQQNIDRLHVVDGRRPVQRRLAGIVGGVDVRLGADQILHHPLDGQPGGQDERRRPFVHPRVQVRRAIPEQDLEDAESVRGDGGVQRRSAGVVLGVGVGAGVQQPLRGVGARVPRRQVQRRLAGLVHRGVELGTLGHQFLDDGAGGIVLVVFARVHAAAPRRRHHYRSHAARTWTRFAPP
jgi:hypothetical protein